MPKVTELPLAATLTGAENMIMVQNGDAVRAPLSHVTGLAESAALANDQAINLWPDVDFRLANGDLAFSVDGFPLYGVSAAFRNQTWDPNYKGPHTKGAWQYNPASADLMAFELYLNGPGFADAGIAEGDVVSIAAEVTAPSGKVAIFCRWFGSRSTSYGWVGGQLASAAGYVTFTGPTQILKIENVVVPAGAIGLVIYLADQTPTSAFRVTRLWSVKGAVIGNAPPASLGWRSKELICETALADTIDKAGYAVANAFDYSALTPQLVAASKGITARTVSFTGWGDVLVPAGVSFNAVRFTAASHSRPDGGARSMRVVVRAGPSGTAHTVAAPIVAVGQVDISGLSNSFENVIIPLRDPATGALITLDDGDLSDEYFVGYWFADAAGSAIGYCNEMRGTMPNRVSPVRSYYSTTTNPGVSAWADYSGDGPIALDHVLLTGLVEAQRISEEALVDIQERLTAIGTTPEIISMPPVLYGVQGREMNLYFDNLVFADREDFHWNVAPAGTGYGAQQNERWTYVPGGAALNTSLSVEICNKQTGALMDVATASLKTALMASTAKTWRLLVIGDSTTAAGVTTEDLLTLEASDPNVSLSLIGTKGTAPNRHEGIGGWTVARWYQPSGGEIASNPFSNAGAPFNFAYAMANGLSSFSAPTHVIFNLGINDCFNLTSDALVAEQAAADIVKLNAMIASIQAYGPTIKIGVAAPIPPSRDQDAFGANYGVGQTRWRYKRNILIYAREIIAAFRDREASQIYVLPINVALDTVNNFPRDAAAPVNSRSAITAQRQNNGVHPQISGSGNDGYSQTADVYWAWLNVVG